ncbi:carbohydrate ABC transporter permease [Helcobacillus massiliensis]|uniref:carbohydrate ABC transporter permease n=1 Tax=Helcobacillus TaxID=1161125 RepID=UPI001EF748DD|nr:MULTISPECIES: carbohydrate ABC transporter permease [Helcobacillus]MCG7427077.1 carbohydrate ABC transporter permease [Helcobacillus sp. ACRRO]MCT1557779.1 carbohydrate ABC transporter permease [Helcobacillus massiliensis]MCT2036983.1 carbohydrate ABC transporter permease [Helcobacillus massiliensis]MCT2332196.1 carbohydrate ABC transporter permease [Helcobacillus massiliensis]
MSTATASHSPSSATGNRASQGPVGGRSPQRYRHRNTGPFSKQNLVGTLVGGYLPLVMATLVVALPLLWMVISSFKSPHELVTQDLVVWPEDPSLANYRTAMNTVPIPRFFLNSVIVTVIGSVIKIVLAIFTAYALVFVRFPFKRVIFVLILVALMVPPQVAILPNYVLIAQLGGVNTYWGIIVPGLGTAFGTFLLRQQFLSIPPSILEAATLDGAGHWKSLWRVVVPISVPSIATVALVTIVTEWNDYIWPLIIVTDSHMMTLPVGLTALANSEGNTGSGWGILMAGAVLIIIPILVVFAMLQRYIVSGLTQGSVTG